MVNEFAYTKATRAALNRTLSAERLTRYTRETGGDHTKAIRLYTWNSAVSAAFYTPLQGLEVALRNPFDIELSKTYGPAWYDNPKTGLSAAAVAQVSRAKRDLQRNHQPEDTPHIIAALSFGFWERLLSHGPSGKKNYEMVLWRPALHRAFPHAEQRRRQTVHQPIQELRNLRNRIAHHEPVFHRNLTADHSDIIRVLGWVCPITRDWVVSQSAVPDLLKRTP